MNKRGPQSIGRLFGASRQGSNLRRKANPKLLQMELLEPRQMLASDFHNSLNPLDVTNDGFIAPDDLNAVVTELLFHENSDSQTGLLDTGPDAAGFPYVDVDCDGYVSPIDFIYGVNWLTSPGTFDSQQIARLTNSLFPWWSVEEFGGSDLQRGNVENSGCSVVMTEGDSFVVAMKTDMLIPAGSSAIKVTYSNLNFDSSDSGFINDAFEIALVDRDGNSLVENFASDRDSLFNITEGEPAAFGSAIPVQNESIEIPLSGIPEQTEATLIIRLVNNDGDTGSSVRISDVKVVENANNGGFPNGAVASLPRDARLAQPPVVATPDTGLLPIEAMGTGDVDAPSLVVRAAAGRFPVGQEVIIEGSAIPASGDLTTVRVNGRPVDSIDAKNRYFASEMIKPGINEFEVVAIDSLNQESSATISIEGISDEAIDLSAFEDITGSLGDIYSRTSFAEGNNTLHVKLAAENLAGYFVGGPLLLGIKNISSPTVSATGADFFDSEGTAYLELPDVLAENRLLPGESTASVDLSLHNPERVQFDYDVLFLGALNQAPFFTTTPVVEASPGMDYEYGAHADDVNGDGVSYTLEVGPEGMQIDEATGELTWRASTSNFGNHSVQIRASDGDGGIAEQAFTVTVVPEFPNRPPVFVSTPETSVSISETDRYGKLVVSNDEWHLSDTGFAESPDGTLRFVENLTQYFTGGGPGRFLAFSNNFSVTGAALANAMATLGHEWTVSTTVDFTVDTLAMYDAVFIGGYAASTTTLTDFVQSGGNVYLFGGTGNRGLGNAEDEANTWNPFLKEFGLEFETEYNSVDGLIPIPSSSHPILNGAELYQLGGNSIIDLDETDNLGTVIALQNDDALFAIFDQAAVQSVGHYFYDADAIDPDRDDLRYSLTTHPGGMWIDEVAGTIHWNPSAAQIGNHNVVLEASDDRGGIATQEFVVCVHGDPNNNPPVIISTAHEYPQIPPGFLRWNEADGGNGHFYKPVYVAEGIDWQEAHDAAITAGGFLATPSTEEENDFIFGLIENDLRLWDFFPAFGNTGGPWIGGIQLEGAEEPADGWRWINGEDNGFYNWATGEPNNFGGGTTEINEDVMVYWNQASAPGNTWNDWPRTNIASGYIIELDTLNYQYDIEAIDPDNDPIEYSLIAAPGGLAVDSITGTVSGQFHVDELPTGVVEVEANDGRGGSDRQQFRISLPQFGNATVFGDLFDDANGNGVRDATDMPLHGWQVFLDANQNGELDSDERATFSDVAGRYEFGNLAAGSYSVVPTAETNWQATTATPILVALTDDEVLGGLAFGFAETGNDANSPPRFLSPHGDLTFVVNDTGRTQLDAEDDDNDLLSFRLVSSPSGMTVHPTLGTLAWTPKEQDIGIHQVIVQVSDGRGGIDQMSLSTSVSFPNHSPTIILQPPTMVVSESNISLLLSGQDADHDALSFTLKSAPTGMTIEQAPILNALGVQIDVRHTIEWIPSQSDIGMHAVTVVAADGRGGIAEQAFTLEVVGSATNFPPVIKNSPPLIAQIGRSYVYQVDATDPNSDPVSYALPVAPSGMAINALGLISWLPESQQAGPHDVRILVDDGRGGVAEQAFSVTVRTQTFNTTPVITSVPTPVAALDREYEYDVVARDVDGDPLMFELVSAPRGVSIHPSLGTIRWNPDDRQFGKHTIAVRAQDPQLAEDTQTFTVEVRCTNARPVITSVPPTRAVVGQDYVYPVRVEDLEDDDLFYLLNDPPLGFGVDTDGVIRWTPQSSDIGPHEISIGVFDEAFAYTEQNYTLVVVSDDDPLNPGDPTSPTFGNRPPVITSDPVFNTESDVLYRYDVSATDPDGDPISFSLSSAPSGMSIDNGTGVLTWTANQSQLGQHLVTLEVTDDGNASARQSYVLRVAENEPPTIVSLPAESVVAGAKYRYYVDAVDPDGDPLQFSLQVAPDGVTVDPLGRILWQTDSSDAGTSQPIELAVQDDHGHTDTQAFTLNVSADTTAPRVDVGASKNGVVQFVDRVHVDVGTGVTIAVFAVDDVRVESVQLILDGQLRPLDSNGLFQFHTTTVKTIEAVATATDAAGNTSQATIFIDVGLPGTTNPPSPTDPTLPPNPGIDPADNQAPFVETTSPEPATTISDVVSIIGTVDDPEDNLWYYRVFYGRADQVSVTALDMSDPDWMLLHEGTEEVIDGELAVFDPSAVTNDPYVIAVAAYDSNGQGYIQPTVLYVEGNILVDNFRLEFTDLSIPLAGIPIEVNRVYDTANARDEGDFGFGWMFGVQDARILEVASVGQGGAFNGGNDKFVPDKTKVYLTNPAGQRVGFTYKEELISASFFGGIWRPYFEADHGVYDTLTIDESEVARGGIIGSLAQGINPNAYTLTTKDGLKYRYSEVDGLQTITDLNGNVVTFSDDGIAHSSGDEIAYVRDHRGRIKEIVDPAGNKIVYDYNADGDLVGVTNQANLETRYDYLADPEHYLDQAFDSLGNRVLKAVYEEDADSGQFEFKGVIDAAGDRIDDRDFDTDARTGIIRDGNGNATTLIYDDRGNVLEEIDALGNKTIREYGDPQNPDLETRIIDREGNITDREYDSLGNLTRITELGSAGNPLAEPVTTEFTYDAGNRVTSIANGLGAVTVFGYDGSGNLTQITNADGHSSSFTYDDQGRRQSFTDFNDNTTAFEYDASCPCGSPSRVGFADGTYQVFAYNQFGQVTLEEFYEADDTLAERRETKYDDIGRVTEEISGNSGDPNHPQTIVRSIYEGHLLDWQIIVHPDSLDAGGYLLESPATPVADRKSRITDFEYDENDQLIRQIDAEGGVVEFRYDAAGNRVLLQDPVGNTTTWVYDELNRVSEERDPFFNEGLTIEQVLAELEVDSGADCDTDAGAAHVRLSCYDAEGNQAKTIDRNGRRREFAYDHAGRLLTESWFAAGSGALVETISFSYDALGNMLSATDSNSNYLFTYDALNRLESVDNNPDGSYPSPRVVLDYSYDAQGNVIQTSDGSGVTVDSTYNARNRLATRSWFDADTGGDVDDARVDFFYTAAGREQEVRRYSDLNANTLVGRTVRTYDAAGRSNLLNHVNAADELLAGYDYDYDFSGLLLHEARSHQDSQYEQTIDYLYDLTGQLTGADFDTQDDESFVYDANGNRISSTLGSETRNYTTDTANQLESDGVHRYEYDGEGNQIKRVHLTTGETRTFVYDHRNRLIRVDDWSADPGDPNNPVVGVVLTQSVEYTYDALGRRIARGVDSDGEGPQPIEKEHFVYNGDNVWADVDEMGNVVKRYLFGNRIDKNVARWSSDEGTVWYLADRLGTIRDIADTIGQIINHNELGTFGQSLLHTNPATSGRYLFTGRELINVTTDVYYYRARFYDSSEGRFLGNDPLGFDANDPNLYRYVSNSPMNALDPLGTKLLQEITLASTIVVPITFTAGGIGGFFGPPASFGEGASNAVLGVGTVLLITAGVGVSLAASPAAAAGLGIAAALRGLLAGAGLGLNPAGIEALVRIILPKIGNFSP